MKHYLVVNIFISVWLVLAGVIVFGFANEARASVTCNKSCWHQRGYASTVSGCKNNVGGTDYFASSNECPKSSCLNNPDSAGHLSHYYYTSCTYEANSSCGTIACNDYYSGYFRCVGTSAQIKNYTYSSCGTNACGTATLSAWQWYPAWNIYCTPAPTVTLSASPNPVDYNSPATLYLTITNATACSTGNATGGWELLKGGTYGVSENYQKSTGNLTANTTYTLGCTGPGGSGSGSVTVNIKKYKCSGNTCQRDDSGGSYTSSSCNNACDVNAPTGTISINSGATYTTGTSVSLALTCSDNNGCSQMSFSNDNSSWSSAETYTTSKSWMLASGDGTKTVYVKFKDALGNWSGAGTYYDSIVLDTAAPTMSVTPASGTTGTSISYTVYWQDTLSGLVDPYGCYIVLDGTWYGTSCSGTGQKTYSGSFTTAGSHTVLPYGNDVAGNYSYGSAYSYTVSSPTCSPSSVTNGTVAAYPSCAITCNSGYTLSGSTCVAIVCTATIYANGVASSVTADYNTAANLTWTSTNATSCTGTNFSTGGATNNSTGVSTGNLYGTQTYSISCTGSCTTGNSSVVVHVNPVYTACSGSACVLNTGIEGQTYSNLCSFGGNCSVQFHSECANNQCVIVSGAGTNECSRNSNCGGSGDPVSPRGICAQGTCVMVDSTKLCLDAGNCSSCSNYGATCPNPAGSSYNLYSSNDLKMSITKDTGTACSGDTTLTIEPLSGFSDTVDLSVNDWGELAAYSPTANFSKTALTSAEYSSGATLNICVLPTVPSYNYLVIVRGSGETSGKVIDRQVKVILHNAASSSWREM